MNKYTINEMALMSGLLLVWALRMAFQPANVLILDEVTSSVDKETAKEIYELFLKGAGDRITFIISHDDVPAVYANRVVSVA